MVSFIVLVLFAGISKNGQRKKYYVIYIVIEYVKIIQHRRCTEKWIIIKMQRHKWMKMMKIWMID